MINTHWRPTKEADLSKVKYSRNKFEQADYFRGTINAQVSVFEHNIEF